MAKSRVRKTARKRGRSEASEIGQRITAVMERLGLNATEFARRVGVSKSQVSEWTSGLHEARISSLKRIAKRTGCTVDELLGL